MKCSWIMRLTYLVLRRAETGFETSQIDIKHTIGTTEFRRDVVLYFGRLQRTQTVRIADELNTNGQMLGHNNGLEISIKRIKR